MRKPETETKLSEPFCCLCGQAHPFEVACEPARIIDLRRTATLLRRISWGAT
jgi:hypothetical protein